MRIDNIKVTGSIANSGSLATLSGSFSGSFAGNGEEITGIISSSYATTASYAISSSHEILQEITSSYADTASLALEAESATTASYIQAANIDGEITASTVDFDNITNKPVLYSSSTQLVDVLDGQDLSLGVVSASILHEIYTTQSINLGSGSFLFGDTIDDTHTFTGSVQITGSLDIAGNIDSIGQIYQDRNERETFIGYNAGINARSETYNVGIGYQVLENLTSGSRNVAIGFESLEEVIEGDYNIGVGFRAGRGITNGNHNTYLGVLAGSDATGGTRRDNTGIGYRSGEASTTGDYNTTVGSLAGYQITTGDLNTFVGWRAGGALTTGNRNVAMGSNADWVIMNGDDNTVIGYNTRLLQTNDSHSIVIGSGVAGRGDGTTTIGSTNTTSTKLYGSLEIDGITDVSASIASLEGFSASLDTTFATDSDLQNLIDKTGSYATTSSVNELIDKTGSYATTGSNTFTGDQTINAATLEIDNAGDAQIVLDRGANANDAEIVFQTNNTLDWAIGTGQVGGDADFTIRHQNNNNIFRLSGTGLNINTSISASEFSGSFRGNGSQLTGLVSASYAETASYVSSSNIDGDIVATEVAFNNITGLPTLLSSSTQISSEISGAFTSTSASIATNISSSDARLDVLEGSHLVSGSNDTVVINNITASNFYTDGFYYGDGRHLTGVSASLIQNGLLFGDGLNGGTYTGILDVTSSINTSSAHFLAPINEATQSLSQSFATDLTTAIANVSGAFDSISSSLSASIATNVVNIESNASAITTLNDAELLSSSLQIADDISGSFTQLSASLEQRLTTQETNVEIDSASLAQTASFVTGSDVVGTVNSSSHAITASYALNALTASYAISSSHEIIQEITSSYAETASYALRAEVEISKEISSSIADTASYIEASNIDGTVTSASYALSASHVIGLDVETSSYATTSSYTHTSSLAQRLELENVDTTDQQFTFALVNTESRSVVSYDTNDLLFNPSSGELEITGLTVTNFTISGSNTGQGTIQDALTASFAIDAANAVSTETASLADEVTLTTMPAMIDTYYPTLTPIVSDRGIIVVTSSIYYDRPNETLYVPNLSGSFEGDGSGITGITADSVTFANVTNKPTLISSSNQLDGFVSQSAAFVANEFIVANGANSVTSSNLLSVDMTEQRIGIGTTSPTVKLDIVGETGGEAQMRLAQHDNSSDGPDMRFFKSRGTEDSPAAVNADDYIGAVNAFSYDGSNYQQSGFFGFQSLGTGGEANFSIKTRLDGAFPDRLTIDGEGDVHISGDLFAPTITGSLFRLSENGQGMRLTNVGGFENYSGTFNIFSNNDIFLRAGGASDSFAVATLHQSNQRAEFHGQVSASLFSGSFVGDGSELTGIAADSVDFDNVTNKPTLLSGSAQITDLTTYTENVSGGTSYDIDHNLNERYPIVQAWNTTNHNMEIPATVVSNTVNQVTITFGAEFAGRIIVKK